MVNKKLTAISSDTHGKFLWVWQPWIANEQLSRFDCAILSRKQPYVVTLWDSLSSYFSALSLLFIALALFLLHFLFFSYLLIIN